jgi:hypothetical protein
MGVQDIPAERNLKSGPLHPCAGVDILFLHSFKELLISTRFPRFPHSRKQSSVPSLPSITEMGKLIEDEDEGGDEEVSSLMRRFLAK